VHNIAILYDFVFKNDCRAVLVWKEQAQDIKQRKKELLSKWQANRK